ncbi:hypothetical protein A3C17_00625 [Candidatus Uhrbacteria bacterium RIFCSPHIGHO2_02_FULL_53_13]|uniref:CARDB domain-containing protein n=1 Tax=Candidatus Uhrbacteria bacterium RIFCSPHIGHO2_02_FULL_53_13 TaxID=1802389 RepID=A0A1F7TYF6_9BACT|nr:MAG: hypothetical protein A3C17_00625 [Candidatus Uhrbacteria bacterium RIFCSPHIGHO2_02_FULL_53_13]
MGELIHLLTNAQNSDTFLTSFFMKTMSQISLLLRATSFTALVAVFVLALAASPSVTRAAGANDLVKCADFSAVYLIGDNGKRYSFPNEKIFFTWHPDFDEVKEISCDDLATLPLAGVVKYRAGVRLVKIPSVPKVYAVESDGTLRPIRDEVQARKLYGEGWSQAVDDLPESFFPRYSVKTELKDDELPEGMILEDDGKLLQVDEDGEAVEVEGVFTARDKALLRRHAHKVEALEGRLGRALSKIAELEQELERLQRLLDGQKAVRVNSSDHKTVTIKEVKNGSTVGTDNGRRSDNGNPDGPARDEKKLPDLVVSDLLLGNSTTGSGAALTAVIGNTGTAEVTQDVTVYFWLDDVLEWTYNSSTLADKTFKKVGGSSTVSPQHIEGTRTIKVCIDTRDIVAESNENNNCRTETLEAPEGDFTISDVGTRRLDASGNASETLRTFDFQTSGPLDHYRIRIWNSSGNLHDELVQQVMSSSQTNWTVLPTWLTPLALGQTYTFQIHAEEYLTGDANDVGGTFVTEAAAVVASPALELSVKSEPYNTYTRGQSNAYMGEFTFTNSASDAVEVQDITFQLVGDTDGNQVPVNENISNVQNHISSCFAKNGSTMVSSVEGVGTDGFVTLDSLNWAVASNGIYEFDVYCALTTTLVDGGNTDLYLARVNDVNSFVAQYALTGNALSSSEKALDSTGALNSDAQHSIQVVDQGFVILSLHPSTPSGAVTLQPSALNEVGVFRAVSQYEDVIMNQVTFYVKAESTVSSVVIEYQDALGNTVTKTGVPVGGYVTFSGADILVEDSTQHQISVSLMLGTDISVGDNYVVTMHPTGYALGAVGQTSGAMVSSSMSNIVGMTVIAQ